VLTLQSDQNSVISEGATAETATLRVLPCSSNTSSRQAAMFGSFQLLRQFLDCGPCVMVLNSRRQIVFASSALLELMGEQELDTLVGLRLGEAFHCIHSDDTPAGCGTTEFCQHCGGTNAILSAQKGLPNAQECRITRRVESREEPLDLLVKASQVEVAGERYVVCHISDISHEKRRYALEHIFLHDILNTAGNILNLTEAIEESSPEDARGWLDLMSLAARRLVSEIQGQRQLAEAETGELALSVASVQTRSVLAGIAAIYASSPEGRGRNLMVAAGAENLWMATDPALLSRVLSNLVKNALEASLPGQTITLDCRSQGNKVDFTVHNPAVMPAEVRRQVFQRSFSTKGVGRGLGTYSVKLLTERYLGGTAAFRSAAGEGTTFRVVYPQCLPSR
jgi:signal transduction histidine kinase